jgi:hypothetical protein
MVSLVGRQFMTTNTAFQGIGQPFSLSVFNGEGGIGQPFFLIASSVRVGDGGGTFSALIMDGTSFKGNSEDIAEFSMYCLSSSGESALLIWFKAMSSTAWLMMSPITGISAITSVESRNEA